MALLSGPLRTAESAELMSKTYRIIEQKLIDTYSPEVLEIVDESHLHEGHSGAAPGGETHFRVHMVAAAFDGMGRLDRQRAVLSLVAGFARRIGRAGARFGVGIENAGRDGRLIHLRYADLHQPVFLPAHNAEPQSVKFKHLSDIGNDARFVNNQTGD